MDERLKNAIGSAKIQQHAGELVRLALITLGHMRGLDESLYERFVASRNAPIDPGASAIELRALWDRTFTGLFDLLDYCRSLDSGTRPATDVAPDVSFEWDLEGGDDSPATPINELDLAPSAIGDLVAGIDDGVDDGDTERWADVRDKLTSIEYGLRSQYTDGHARLEVALAAGETNQVLGLLDDTQSSASEGVHAIVAAIYGEFLPDVNAASVVPGYHTSLGRALMVRRGLAELQTTLDPLNALLQAGAKSADFALRTIRDAMETFVSSVLCRAMRAADRWQMIEFERELAAQPIGQARQTSEGLVKYLDSLRSISQREVLLIHDRRAFEEMRESLASARQLLDLSPRTATDLVDRAYQAALRMRGRRPDMDELILHLDGDALAAANPTELVALIDSLEAVLATG